MMTVANKSILKQNFTCNGQNNNIRTPLIILRQQESLVQNIISGH